MKTRQNDKLAFYLIEEIFVKTNHVHDRGLMRKHDDPISLKKKRNEASYSI